MIMHNVRSFLYLGDKNYSGLPWNTIGVTDLNFKEENAKIKAFEEHLGVRANGSLIPLSYRQKIVFGSSLGKLAYKVKKARTKAEEILRIIGSFKSWEDDAKDTRLMRHFILECLSPFKRYTLEYNNTTHDGIAHDRPSWPAYIASWFFIVGTIFFFMGWILQWGLYEGGDNLTSWGNVYGTAAASDVIFVAIAKVILINYLPAQAMQAQLLRIRGVLADVSLNYINRHENSEDLISADGKENVHDEVETHHTISVVQHMSAACRAARSKELKALPAAWLLRQVRSHIRTILK